MTGSSILVTGRPSPGGTGSTVVTPEQTPLGSCSQADGGAGEVGRPDCGAPGPGCVTCHVAGDGAWVFLRSVINSRQCHFALRFSWTNCCFP